MKGRLEDTHNRSRSFPDCSPNLKCSSFAIPLCSSVPFSLSLSLSCLPLPLSLSHTYSVCIYACICVYIGAIDKVYIDITIENIKNSTNRDDDKDSLIVIGIDRFMSVCSLYTISLQNPCLGRLLM